MSENQMEEPVEQAGATEAEVQALQAEVADLRRQVAETKPKEEESRHLGRRWAVGLLIALACILLAVGSVTLWVRDVVLDTDTWVATIGPLTRNPVVAETLSAYVVSELFSAVDVEGVAQEALPQQFAVLSGAVTGLLRDLATDTVSTAIQSDQFNAAWATANRAAHAIAMEALRGDRSLLYLEDGSLTLDFSDILGTIEGTLGLQELGLFSGEEAPGKLVLFTSAQVAFVQQVLAVIDTVGILLPLLALITFVLAWLISLWRRCTVKWIGIGIVITMALSLLVMVMLQPVILASIGDPVVRLVADEVWDVIMRGLIIQTILLMAIGALLAIGAALAGPSPRAVAFRSSVSDSWSSISER
jgi:hypothetical protein